MADRIHPKDSSPTSDDVPVSAKPVPPPGTYVVQIPKEQIYRYPPPENAVRYKNLQSRRKTPRNGCCCCFCWLLGLITLLILLIAIAGAIIYLVFRPEAPKYAIDKISIKGFNLTGSSLPSNVNPQFDVTVRAENPNNKIGIYYNKGSSVTVSHSNNKLCNGVIPAFYQPTNNVTVLHTALTSSGPSLTMVDLRTFREQQMKREIPLGLDLKVPVKIKFGSVKTWTITVKVNCYITVDKLAMDASIVSKKCDVDVKPW